MRASTRIRGLASAFLLLLAAVLASCGTREDNGLGVSFIEDQSELKAVRETLVAPPDTSADFQLSEPPATIGTAGTILVGERGDLGYRSRGLVRFDPAAFPDSATALTGATFSFVYLEGLPESGRRRGRRTSVAGRHSGGSAAAGGGFTMTIHRVTSDWNEGLAQNPDSFPAFDPTPAATFDFGTPVLGDTLSFSLLPLAQEWVDLRETNFGVALVPEPGSSSMVELKSDENTSTLSPPRLEVRWSPAGVDTTVSLRPTADTFVLEKTAGFTTLAGVPGRLTVGRGVPTRFLLRFPLPDLGPRATVNKAEMTLHYDPSQSDFDDFTLSVLRVSELPWNADSTVVSSTQRIQTARAADDSVTIPMTDLVRESIDRDNLGFLVRANDERPDVDFLRVHGRDSEIPELVPSLRIWYTPGDQP